MRGINQEPHASQQKQKGEIVARQLDVKTVRVNTYFLITHSDLTSTLLLLGWNGKGDSMSTTEDDEWFRNFVRKLPGAELVEDALASLNITAKPRNADYFFEHRRFIGELKTLETSRIPTIQATIDNLRDKGELPVFYHPAPISEVIKDHPDAKKLNKQFLMEIAKALERDFREANAQIRETKDAFKIPAAKGFILITNSELQEMTLELALNELNRLIKRTRGNAFAYDHLDFAIYLQNVEVRERNKDYAEEPVLVVVRDENDTEVGEFVDQFLRAIAIAKGIDFLAESGDAAAALLKTVVPHRRFTAKIQASGTPSEVWKARYLAERRYRDRTDDELVAELARFTLEEYWVLKDDKISVNMSDERIHETIEGLFTECELRFIDMRKVRPKMWDLIEHGTAKGDVADFLRRQSSP